MIRPPLAGLVASLAVLPATVVANQPEHPSQMEIPALEAGDEGIWTWVERMEGEVLTDEVLEVLEERSDEQFAAMGQAGELGAGAVPMDFYRDPRSALGGDPLHLDKLDPSEFDIPIVVNDSVKTSMRYFLGPGRKYFAKWLGRAHRYHPLMLAELEEQGLPLDIVYLSMIESGYSTHAYSYAHAAGLWQFMSSTGRMYGLRVDWWVDERRDPLKATKAAVHYLSDLNKMFDGDWLLAFAAYNGGPGRVRRSIQKAGEADFWVLQEGPYLHSETDGYVPKIIAAAIIGKHPERYGFVDIVPLEEVPSVPVSVKGSVEVDRLATLAGVSLDYFRLLNPALRRGATPQGSFEVNVPPAVKAAFRDGLGSLPPSALRDYVQHKVKGGETLSSIARGYGLSTDEVARANSVENANRIYVGMELIIPVPGAGAERRPAESRRAGGQGSPSGDAPSGSGASSHVVLAGDSLWGIAEKYGVTVSDLSEWNSLNGSVIQPGQELVVRGGQQDTVTYTVQPGDSLIQIAAMYGVTLGEVQEWNHISNPSKIRIGQALVLHPGRAMWGEHKVRAGDSLSAIADDNGCSVADLVAWNELRSTVIQPGQTLRFKR